MGVPVFALSEKAQAELAQSRKDAYEAFNKGINRAGIWFPVTLEQAQAMHRERAMRIYREGMVEVDPDSTVRIQCAYCQDESSVMRSVKTFKCRCSPHEEQWVLKSRSIHV